MIAKQPAFSSSSSLCIAIATVYLSEPGKRLMFSPNFKLLRFFCSWRYAGLTKCLQKKCKLHIKVIRFTNSLGPRSRITADTLAELNLLDVEARVKQLRLNHMHTIFYEFCPTYLKETFVPLKGVSQWLWLLSVLRRWFCCCCFVVDCYYHCGTL